jgi:hypothetical protein
MWPSWSEEVDRSSRRRFRQSPTVSLVLQETLGLLLRGFRECRTVAWLLCCQTVTMENAPRVSATQSRSPTKLGRMRRRLKPRLLRNSTRTADISSVAPKARLHLVGQRRPLPA